VDFVVVICHRLLGFFNRLASYQPTGPNGGGGAQEEVADYSC
jgi:hypothetical protein